MYQKGSVQENGNYSHVALTQPWNPLAQDHYRPESASVKRIRNGEIATATLLFRNILP